MSKPIKGLYCHLGWHKQDWANINKFDRNNPGTTSVLCMPAPSKNDFICSIYSIFLLYKYNFHYHASYKIYFSKFFYMPIKLYNSILYSILKTSVPKLFLSTHYMVSLVYVDAYMIFF